MAIKLSSRMSGGEFQTEIQRALDKSGDTMTGDLLLPDTPITDKLQAVNKNYVDTSIADTFAQSICKIRIGGTDVNSYYTFYGDGETQKICLGQIPYMNQIILFQGSGGTENESFYKVNRPRVHYRIIYDNGTTSSEHSTWLNVEENKLYISVTDPNKDRTESKLKLTGDLYYGIRFSGTYTIGVSLGEG